MSRPRDSASSKFGWGATPWSLATLMVLGGCPDKSDDGAKKDDGKVAGAVAKPGDANAPPAADQAADSPAAVDPPKAECPEGMALIPEGKFFMGTDAEQPIFGRARPAHQVTMPAYCIGIDEVTVAQYSKCVEAGACAAAHEDVFWPNPSGKDEDVWKHDIEVHGPLCTANKPDRLDHAINCVTWAQADAYCGWAKTRLPTEAEWEFAARGSDGRVFPWGDAPPDATRANVCDSDCVEWRKEAELSEVEPMFVASDGFAGTSPVGQYPAGSTQHGLHDIVGNVFEWTSDYEYAYESEPQTNPHGPPKGENRVIRGGAFNSQQPEWANPALRYAMNEKAYTHGIGFRCAADKAGR